jgi:hypothetical protein
MELETEINVANISPKHRNRVREMMKRLLPCASEDHNNTCGLLGCPKCGKRRVVRVLQQTNIESLIETKIKGYRFQFFTISPKRDSYDESVETIMGIVNILLSIRGDLWKLIKSKSPDAAMIYAPEFSRRGLVHVNFLVYAKTVSDKEITSFFIERLQRPCKVRKKDIRKEDIEKSQDAVIRKIKYMVKPAHEFLSKKDPYHPGKIHDRKIPYKKLARWAIATANGRQLVRRYGKFQGGSKWNGTREKNKMKEDEITD